jgi:hypothetical protein
MIIDLAWMIFSCGLNICAAYLATHRAKQLSANIRPLPDVLLEILPILPDWIPDIFVLIIILLDILVPFIIHGDVNDYSGLKHIVNMFTYIMFIRSLTTWVTTLPSPLLTKSSLGYGQHDLIFSGHTAIMFCAAKSNIGYLFAGIGTLTVLCARQHYTVDVIIAIVIVELTKHTR